MAAFKRSTAEFSLKSLVFFNNVAREAGIQKLEHEVSQQFNLNISRVLSDESFFQLNKIEVSQKTVFHLSYLLIFFEKVQYYY